VNYWAVPAGSFVFENTEEGQLLATADAIESSQMPQDLIELLDKVGLKVGDGIAIFMDDRVIAMGHVTQADKAGYSWQQSPMDIVADIATLPRYEVIQLDAQEAKSLWQQMGEADIFESSTVSVRDAENIIFYGPPGTGKTYHVIERALQLIVTPDEYALLANDRQAMNRRFRQLQTKGQIEFVTFHQSYSYEEFVEGLRPILDEQQVGEVRYEIADGILKRIAMEADTSTVVEQKTSSWNTLLKPNPSVWKVSLCTGDDPKYKQHCFDHSLARIGWDRAGDLSNDNPSDDEQEYRNGLGSKNLNTLEYFSSGIEVGDIVVSLQSQKTIDAVGIVIRTYFYDAALSIYKNCIGVEWIHLGELDFFETNSNKNLVQKTVYRLPQVKPADVLALIPSKKKSEPLQGASVQKQQYVLIIDEINRGNISKIFGELITLLEPSKRLGGVEALKLKLPYSQTDFGLPSNLNIIGTMNTADRSIALMDVALRRRFTYEEMMPDSAVIRKQLRNRGCNEDFVQLVDKLFIQMNGRIRFLYDRDHQLGHAYFLSVSDFSSLKRVVLDRIIPLLQEYFYGSWEKICLVLGCPYDEETNQPQRRATHLLSGVEYSSPIIVSKYLDEKTTLGFDHEDYNSYLEFDINPQFIKCPDDSLLSFFLNILEMDVDEYQETLGKLNIEKTINDSTEAG
jgi:5-methylcytosine-specific restriction protein B